MKRIPKYVQEIMGRAQYEYSHPKSSAGYTLRIWKATPQTLAETFREELEWLVRWSNRWGGEDTARIHKAPLKTHYHDQYAIVTIYNPVMMHIEKYIQAKEKK